MLSSSIARLPWAARRIRIALFSAGTNDIDSAGRAEQARGAMKQYFNNANENIAESSTGLWSKLRKDFKEKEQSHLGTGKTASPPVYSYNKRTANNKRGRGGSSLRKSSGFGDSDDGSLDEMFDDYHSFDVTKEFIDTSSMDDIDALVARSFEASCLTKDGSYLHSVVLTRKVAPPRVRCIRALAQSAVPDIRGVPESSTAFWMASDAWSVLSKNKYFTDSDKDFICNSFARLGHHVIETADKDIADEDIEGNIYSPFFKKGLAGMEELEVVDEVTNDKDTFDATTKWEEEAVVDEDQL